MDYRREGYDRGDDDNRRSFMSDDDYSRYDRQPRFRDEGYRRPYTGRFGGGSRGHGSEGRYRPYTGDYGRSGGSDWDEGRSSRIARAVGLLRQRYLDPLSINELAQSVHMSTSSFHHQFKAVTTMSPPQFQKQLRLHEARRLMMAAGMEAMVAARHVGYESPSQFSREYKRLFGAPPRAEVGRARAGLQE